MPGGAAGGATPSSRRSAVAAGPSRLKTASATSLNSVAPTCAMACGDDRSSVPWSCPAMRTPSAASSNTGWRAPFRAMPARKLSTCSAGGPATSSSAVPPAARPSARCSDSDGSASAWPLPRSSRHSTAWARRCTPACAGQTIDTVGSTRTRPLVPGVVGTSSVSCNGPMGSDTRVPSECVVSLVKSLDSSASHAARALDPSTPPSQRDSAGRPSRASSASGSGVTALPWRSPSRPASAASGPVGNAAACACTRPSTRLSADASSDARSATDNVKSAGAAAPGICNCRSVSAKRGGPSPAVGTVNASAMPPRCAAPGAGAAGSVVMSTSTVTVPSAVPSSMGDDTERLTLAARNSGTCADTDAAGVSDDTFTPTPMPTQSGGLSSITRYTRASGGWALAMGNQTLPSGPVVRSSPASTSSMKAMRAARWPSSASMRDRCLPGSDSQSARKSPLDVSPSASARLPTTPRSFAASAMGFRSARGRKRGAPAAAR